MNIGVDVIVGSVTVNSNRFETSCAPNAVLQPAFVRPNGTILYEVLAIHFIRRGCPATLPFKNDWIDSQEPLNCYKHRENIGECPYEIVRLRKRQLERERNGAN